MQLSPVVEEMFYYKYGTDIFFIGWIEKDGNLRCANIRRYPEGFAIIRDDYSFKGRQPLSALKERLIAKGSIFSNELMDVDVSSRHEFISFVEELRSVAV
jgi:hypothetical protein